MKLRTVKGSVESGSGVPPPAKFECVTQISAILGNFSVPFEKYININFRLKTLFILDFF